MGQGPSHEYQPNHGNINMSGPSPIQSVPDEVLVMIIKEVRAVEQAHKPKDKGCDHTETDERDCSNSANAYPSIGRLSTVSRAFYGPATAVLYENVELTRRNTRQLMHTLVANEELAKLVKTVKTGHFAKDKGGYQPNMCYEISPKTVEDNIKAFAEDKGVMEALELDGKGRVRSKGDIDQLLVALVSRNMTTLDLTLMHPEVTWRRPEVHKMKPRRLFAGTVLKSDVKSSHFGENLTTLKLRAPIGKLIMLSKLAPAFGLQRLRSLTLHRISTKCHSHSNISQALKTFTQELKKVTDKSCITELHLLECSFTATDLESLLKQCPDLKHLHWRVNEKCAYSIHDQYPECIIEGKDLVARIVKSKLTLKSLMIDHLEEMTDWPGVSRRHRYLPNGLFTFGYVDPRVAQRRLFGPADFTPLTSLESLEVTCPVLTSLPDDANDKLKMEPRIPPKAREITLRMPANPFPTNCYNLVPGTRHWKMLVTLCNELENLSLDLPLSVVKVIIPDAWPRLSGPSARKLHQAVAGVERVHLVLDGVGEWKLDSRKAPPVTPKRVNKRKADDMLSKVQEVRLELRDL